MSRRAPPDRGARRPTATAGHAPGRPDGGLDATQEPGGTTHFVVGDAQGNVVSMTTTVESIFGSGRMVDGFFLNNQMTDFSFQPRDAAGRPAANAVAPGKRPRSSMTPAILLDATAASSARSARPAAMRSSLMSARRWSASLDWGLPMQQAIDLPNLIARGANFNGEVDKFAPGVVEALAARGVAVRPGQGEDSRAARRHAGATAG